MKTGRINKAARGPPDATLALGAVLFEAQDFLALPAAKYGEEGEGTSAHRLGASRIAAVLPETTPED